MLDTPASSKTEGARGPAPARLLAGCLIAFLALLLAIAPASAQVVPVANEADAAAEEIADPFGRATPAGTVTDYIQAVAEGDYELASRYLEVPGGGRRGADVARRFQAALDADGQFRPRTELSREPAGDLNDALEANLEQVGTIGRREATRPILLERVEPEGEPPVWLFSSETIKAALRLDVRERVAAEAWLPPVLTRRQIGGAPVSHWLTLVALSALVFVVSWLALRFILFAVAAGAARFRTPQQFVQATVPPLTLLVAVILAHWLAPQLGVSIVARERFAWAILIIGWVALAWLLWNLVNLIAERTLAGFARRGRASATAVVRMASRAAKILIVALALLAILDVLGFEVTAALAALGIGGIALALGAQKTVENLIASLSIISDRPFKVGDTCRFGDVVGTVEDVGMRSTKVRTLDRTLVTIPNSVLAQSNIENLSEREQFWFHPILHVPGTTPPDRLDALLDAMRRALEGHPALVDGKARVRLLLPADGRLPIEVFAYVTAPGFEEFLAVQEELSTLLLAIVADHSIELAPPAFAPPQPR